MTTQAKSLAVTEVLQALDTDDYGSYLEEFEAYGKAVKIALNNHPEIDRAKLEKDLDNYF